MITITKEYQDDVKKTLNNALRTVKTANNPILFSQKLNHNQKDLICKILMGNHKTYKYILFTALATKSTIPSVNILTLQTQSKLPNSYDARSIAHKVVVPFERKYLHKALGGSNEPFLNKPARFPELSSKLPVRKGKDREKLELLIKVLPSFNKTNAFDAVCWSIYILLNIDDRLFRKDYRLFSLNQTTVSDFNIYLRNHLQLLTASSLGGQSLALGIGIIVKLFSKQFFPNSTTIIHPVNEAGSSTLEVGDIDVIDNNTQNVLYTFEAKDKDFSFTDVEHALSKAISANLNSLFFIFGNRVTMESTNIKSIYSNADKLNINLSLLSFDDFLSVVLATVAIKPFNVQKELHALAESATMTSELHSHIDNIFQ